MDISTRITYLSRLNKGLVENSHKLIGQIQKLQVDDRNAWRSQRCDYNKQDVHIEQQLE